MVFHIVDKRRRNEMGQVADGSGNAVVLPVIQDDRDGFQGLDERPVGVVLIPGYFP